MRRSYLACVLAFLASGVLYLGDQELGPLTTFMPWTTADDKSMVTLVYRGGILLPEEAPVDGYRAVLTEAPLSRFGTVELRLQSRFDRGDGTVGATFYWTPPPETPSNE